MYNFLDKKRTFVYTYLMTPTQQKIIDLYEALTETGKIRPSYRVIAKKASCSLATVFSAIKAYEKENKAVKPKF